MKKIFLFVTLMLVMVSLASCVKPYDKPEFITIEASQTAFLIPLIGDTNNQASFESEELLAQAKVATKEIQIPHRWVQTGRRNWTGKWVAAAKLIVVERKPVSRSWESGDNAAESANRAIFGETADAIGVYVGMNCTAMIEEKNATKFLYRYNNTPLETVIDTDIKKMVEGEFNSVVGDYKSTELHDHKDDIINHIKEVIIPYFEEYGITITVLGFKEGISFENPEIQDALDAKFASEQDLVIQQNKNEAALAKAEADAKAVIIAAEAQAQANKLLAESLTDPILAQLYYEKWNGVLPTVYGAESSIIQVPNN
jgi:hypothetical protein